MSSMCLKVSQLALALVDCISDSTPQSRCVAGLQCSADTGESAILEVLKQRGLNDPRLTAELAKVPAAPIATQQAACDQE